MTAGDRLGIRHNPERHRFEADVDGELAHLDYEPVGDDTLDYQHTWTPPAARGRGIGRAMVRYALRYAREHGKKVIPNCPFVKSVMEEDGEDQGAG